MVKCFEEEVSMPLSPMADYFSSSLINVFVLGVLESQIPIDHSRAEPLLKDAFLPISTRFSSILVMEKKGKKGWKEVDVNLQDHIKVPTFPTIVPFKLYDKCFDEYMSKIAMEQLPQNKPLWELHIFKYPTSNAAGTFIFKLHHALGDGYSFMTTLLSCVQNAHDPSIPVKFPSSKRSMESKNTNIMLKILPQTVSMVFKSVFDFGWSVMKDSLIPDDETPIRSGHKDVGFRPMTFSNVSLSLDDIKEVKNKLKVSVNDVVVGVIFLGIQLYMDAKNHKPSSAESTALVLLNTRKIRAYKSAKEMHDKDSEAPWGNRFHFMHVPIPMLCDTNCFNPLEFVLEANKRIKRKRNSLAVPLTNVLLHLLNQIKGPQAAANYVYKIMNNTSLSISHMIGPVEQVALANHPIKGLYFMTVGLSQSITVTITSYMGYIRVGFGVEEDFIDEYQLKSCFETSLEMMLKAAKNVAMEAKL
ncbi:O-acyltransferase WSD1 [Cajanus cajan]|uniref:O-acyltransferase WSD1 n=1 Tax=Cajanus cajan TaxID=3821 RepID=A0A151SF87_CAJCA|nr:O-acyltransferase WSD1 [Cajanus cajan]XP_020229484.1 O-acyltransferase WSD1 [Cajanus cajan]KYP53371.1 O-acyltransferase WSD1 [Cajanus cajan]